MKKIFAISTLMLLYHLTTQAQTYCLEAVKIGETQTTVTVKFLLKSFSPTAFTADATFIIAGTDALSGNTLVGGSLGGYTIGNGLSYTVANPGNNPAGTFTFPIGDRTLPARFSIVPTQGLGVYTDNLVEVTKDPGCPAMELSVPLPLDLKAFTAVKNNKVSDLAWETANERNVSRFEVERSKNGTDFNKIGVVKAVGNSTKLQQYAFVDATPINGTNYYRLKMMDTDGKFKYSPIQSVDFSRPISVKMYPNPTVADVTLDIDADQQGDPLTISITDILGRAIYQQTLQPSKDNLKVALQTTQLAIGTYIITVKNGDAVWQQKLSKQ
jgi:Secretion system C-terminal sorting domain